MPIIELEDGRKLEVLPAEGQSLDQAVDDAVSDLSGSEGAGQMGRRQQPNFGDDRFTVTEAAQTFAQGANRGMAQTVGAPVDLINAGLSAVGLGSETPVGGSRQIIEGGQEVGFMGPDQPREALRPFRVAGEVTGAGATMVGAPLAAAGRTRAVAPAIGGVDDVAAAQGAASGRFAPAQVAASQADDVARMGGTTLQTGGTVGNLGRQITESAARSPGSFTAAETAAVGGAAAGGGAAEALFPGNQAARVSGEVVGGVTSPTAIVTRLAGKLSDDFRRGFQTLTPAGQRSAAGRELSGLLERSGEDLAEVRGRLEGQNEFGLTSAAQSESPTLTALERSLIQKDPQASNALRAQYEDAKANLNNALLDAARSGDPQAFRAAAAARQQYYEGLLDARIAQAEQRSQQASDAISPATEDAPAAAGPRVRDELDDALFDARSMERELWDQVPQDAEVPVDNLTASIRQAEEGLLPTESLPVPSEVRQFLDDVTRRGANGEPVTSGELLRLRSRALELARDARGAQPPRSNEARRLDMIARGALEDLEAVPGDAVTAARQFSAALNEKFTAGPAARLLGRTRSGGERTAPELTLRSTIGQGGDQGAVAAQAQREAVQPIRTDFNEQPPSLRPENIRAEQEQYIRGLLRSAVNPNTGRISPDRLAAFRTRNRELLEQFPELRDATATAEQAERTAASTIRALDARKRAADKTAFARVASVENPAQEISRAIRGSNPTREVGELFSLARRGGEDAQAGARSAFIESMFDQSQQGGFVDGEQLRSILQRHGKQAVSSGVMTEQQVQQLNRVADIADQVRRTAGSNRRLEEEVSNPSAMYDLIASIAGANLGGMSALGQVSGAPLILAGRGAAAARNMLVRAPQVRIENVLSEALQDPQMMAALLRRPSNARQRRALNRQLNAFALQLGITEGEDDGQTDRP